MDKDISLIANSGIQFYTTKLSLKEGESALTVKKEFAETEETLPDGKKQINLVFPYYFLKAGKYIDETTIPKSAKLPNGKIDEDKIDPATIRVIREDQVNTIKAKGVIETFDSRWLPLPYFRTEQFSPDTFQNGPTTWARMYLSRLDPKEATEGYTHSLVLAFDTQCVDGNATYLTPTSTDAEGASNFRCHAKDCSSFVAENWVQDMIQVEFERAQKIQPLKNAGEHLGYLVAYMVLLEALQEAKSFPAVTLRTDNHSIDVDLVLDIGNSRSCGVLLETSAINAPVSLNNATPLKIRDMTYPNKVYSDAFDMRVAFSRVSYGDEAATARSGNPRAFTNPSIVRIGEEATRLTIVNGKPNENATMSSPKRYLWNEDGGLFPWTFINKDLNGSQGPLGNVVLDGIAVYFTNDGVPLWAEEDPYYTGPQLLPAITPKFSRSSLMTFAIAEIITQAITQVNSYEFRKERGQQEVPRKLKRIVLSCPTAMLGKEKELLRKRAEDAVEALKRYFNEHGINADMFLDGQLEVIPDSGQVKNATMGQGSVEWGYDEATCSQLVFMYGEIVHHFRGNARLYFETQGKFRQDEQYEKLDRERNKKYTLPSVRVASVDIGGGTTDVMVATYELEPDANIPVVVPKPNFWEGFNLAGDDMMKRVVETIILPEIERFAVNLGCTASADVMNILFGPNLGMVDAKGREMRRQFTLQVAVPLAQGVMGFAANTQNSIEERDFASFFRNHPMPRPELENFINKQFEKYGAEGFRLRDVTWTLDTRKVNEVVRNVTEGMIRDICGIIAQYDCDVVLLAGRPSSLPVVRDMFLKQLPVTPDKIVTMDEYRVGKWYPFAAPNGVIKDAKTCVAVGATVALMAGTLNRLNGFRIDTHYLKQEIKSTADYIGLYRKGEGKVPETYLDGPTGQDDYELKFYGPMHLGMRQMNSDHWIGTPMCKLDYANNQAAAEVGNRVPLTVEIFRRSPDLENIRIKKITDHEGKPVPSESLTLSLQTLSDEYGYWLDTGAYNLNIFNQ
ncbi:virulence factor SrfB [Limibacter armeniacum]|uniref:virulence factor SrfB n=1 Tax=Limibacter armeniacum TaxID=466084 RepID=UPI002FE625F7